MKSQYEIIQEILGNPKNNYVKIDYMNRAKFDMAAWVRTQLGETVDCIKKSAILSDRTTSSKSTSLLFSMARDTGSRKEDGSWDFRSMIIASLDPDTLKPVQNVPEIMVAENFGTYKAVSLNGLPVFPNPIFLALFETDLLELRRLETLKAAMTKKFDSLKDKLDKNNPLEQFGYKIYFQPPSGKSTTMVDLHGIKIKQTPTVSYGFQLHPVEPIKVEFDANKYEVKNIIELYLEREKISKKIEEKQKVIRPYELGIMERLTDTVSPFPIDKTQFKVVKIKDTSYDWTEADKAKVKNGEYKFAEIPSSRGAWKFEQIVPVSSEIKKSKSKKVEV